ncbi:MAG TPA: extracellular solute-binding protein [Anaerolineales bacterium]|nr:extracellular solute-binding protein [Anaerolineales bacterium]
MSKNKKISRRDFIKLASASGAASMLAACGGNNTANNNMDNNAANNEIPENVNQLSGTTIKVLLNDFPYQHFITDRLSEFESQTGITVDWEMVAWPVLLEQSEIELSSGSDNYDVMIQVFIKAQRWMRAGWSAPLDDFIARDGFDLEDFLPSTRGAMNWEGVQYGIPFLAESTQMAYRKDVLDGASLAVPDTFDDLAAVLEATHNPPDFHSYVARTEPNGVHFPFPIWLQGFGGNIFRDPPNDLTPTLNTAEAVEAATNFVDLILKYSVAGSQTYTTPDCQNAMAQGLAGIWVDALGIFPPIRNAETSQFADQIEIALVPAGPAGRFPQIASHGYQIPKGSKKQEAAWEFIKWAGSKENMLDSALDAGYFAHARESVLTDPAYQEMYNTGDSPIGDLIAEALNLAKVEYRVVPEFPEVGARLGQGIGEMISGQKTIQEALDSVQADVEAIMIAGGNEINP